jgi:hypothetical protein
MRTVKRSTVLACAVLVTVALCSGTAAASAVWGTGLCFPATELGFEGYFEYCYHIYWDTTEYGGNGLSHSTVYLALAECVCACDTGYFDHRIPAGVGIGDGGCDVDFLSEFDCEGDPHFPVPGPTMKFEPVEGECEPGTVGWMHVCYYSLFPPTESTVFTDHLAVKFGQNVELGPLEGVLPYCECDPSATQVLSWGTLKSLYR